MHLKIQKCDLIRLPLLEISSGAFMNDRIFRENISHLTEQLAFETFAPKQQWLAYQIKKEVEKMVQEGHHPCTVSREDGGYWKSRAERTRQRAQRYRSEGLRNYLLEIAAGYEELAKRAYAAQQTSEGVTGKAPSMTQG